MLLLYIVNKLKRNEKNARQREGWDYVNPSGYQAVVDTTVDNTTQTVIKPHSGIIKSTGIGCTPKSVIEPSGLAGQDLTLKLDLCGVLRTKQLISGYYAPIQIDLYLQNPSICCQLHNKFLESLIGDKYRMIRNLIGRH